MRGCQAKDLRIAHRTEVSVEVGERSSGASRQIALVRSRQTAHYISFGGQCRMVDLGDPNQLARRAEVLQRIADQLASQLDVERRSNEALRSLAGEPPALR